MSQRVCAVVVTYNRCDLLRECLDGLMGQSHKPDHIVVVNNASTDATAAMLVSQYPGIPVMHLERNLGSSGGFHCGVRWAYELGFDWIWLMDDDAEPAPNALEELVPFLGQPLAALSCLKVTPSGTPELAHRGNFNLNWLPIKLVTPITAKDLQNECADIEHTSFVGMMIHRRVVDQIGLPNENLFIHFDDAEYCLRFRSVGKMLLVKKSRIIHKAAAQNFEVEPIHRLWLSYYGPRNLIWISNRYTKNKTILYLLCTLKLVYNLARILIRADRKLTRSKFLIASYWDGITGLFDNEKPKRVLRQEGI